MTDQEPPLSDVTTQRHWDCVIVGAGMAGLSARQTLRSARLAALTLEKSRGLGGRMSTRRIDLTSHVGGQALVDLGAQFVSVRSASFRAWVDSVDTRSIRLQNDSQHPRFVPREGMSRLARELANPVDADKAPIGRQTRIVALTSDSASSTHRRQDWRITTEGGASIRSRAMILTAPLPQALDLLSKSGIIAQTSADQNLAQVRYAPCLAAYYRLDRPTGLPDPGILKKVSPVIEGIFDQEQKGLSTHQNCLVVHASAAWSKDHWDHEPRYVIDSLWSYTQSLLPAYSQNNAPPAWDESQSGLHRWRYCEPESPLTLPYYRWSSGPALYLAGDAFGAARLEGAFHSGHSAAEALVAELMQDEEPSYGHR